MNRPASVPAVSAREQTAEWAELKRLAEAATPGPWWDCVNDLIGGRCINTVDKPASELDTKNRESGERTIADFASDKDTAFICAANPQAILALLAEVEQLREWGDRQADLATDAATAADEAETRALAAEAEVEHRSAALNEIEYACFRQYADWMHFHELAMAEPFKAESEAQMFAQRIQGLALEALRAGAGPGMEKT